MAEPIELALLHGFAGAPQAWDRVLAALTIQAHPYAPWLPLHGPNPVEAVDWEDAARVLAAPVRTRGAWWVGYSMGARMAMAVAASCPDAVRGLVLIGGNPGLRSDAEREARRAWERTWADRLRDGSLSEFFAQWSAMPLFASQRAVDERLREQQTRWRLGHDRRSLARAFETFALSGMPDFRPALAALRKPVILLAGDGDAKYCDLGRATAALAEHMTFRSVPGAGHNPLLEAPDALAEVLCTILAQPTGLGPATGGGM